MQFFMTYSPLTMLQLVLWVLYNNYVKHVIVGGEGARGLCVGMLQAAGFVVVYAWSTQASCAQLHI